jgi:hypothetical protein
MEHLSPATRINRISILRQFCLYLSHFDPTRPGSGLVPISVIQKVITPLEDLDGPRLRAHRGKRWSFAAGALWANCSG